MHRILRVAIVLALAITSVETPRVCAGERLSVTLRSGRTFEAAVDERTDEDRLWLRFGAGATTLLRPVAWEAVVAAWRSGQPVALAHLREVAETMKSPVEAEVGAYEATPEQTSVVFQASPPVAFAPAPRVTSLVFDAQLANFDADAEPDGLIIVIRPLDAWGGPTEANGTAEIVLTGAVRRTFDSAPQSGGVVHQVLARWTRPLHGAIPSPDGYLLKLAFPGNGPDPRLMASRGRVRVRLTIPGHGVFEDEREGVVIRPYTPLRDSAAGFVRD